MLEKRYRSTFPSAGAVFPVRFYFQKWYREILQALLISRFTLYHCLLPDALPSGQSIVYLPLPYNFPF